MWQSAVRRVAAARCRGSGLPERSGHVGAAERLLVGTTRRFSTIRIFDEKERADEGLYFSKQDEALLKKIFDAEAAKGADAIGADADADSLAVLGGADASCEDKVKLAFMKNGIPPSANPQLLRDLVDLLLQAGSATSTQKKNK